LSSNFYLQIHSRVVFISDPSREICESFRTRAIATRDLSLRVAKQSRNLGKTFLFFSPYRYGSSPTRPSSPSSCPVWSGNLQEIEVRGIEVREEFAPACLARLGVDSRRSDVRVLASRDRRCVEEAPGSR